MKQKRYPLITKERREYFGGIIFREAPAFVAYINEEYAEAYAIPHREGAIMSEGVFSAPLDAHLAITTRCNMFCKGCYSTRKEDEPRDISLDIAMAVIDKLSELGVFSLSFGGGEPTLHPKIIELAEYAREKQVLPNMTTNGLTMTEELAEKCTVFGNVHFSIHTMSDTEHVFSAARTYHKATRRKPGLNLLLTAETYPRLDEILRNASSAGMDKVLFQRYKETAKNAGVEGFNIDDHFDDLSLRLKELKRANKRLMFLFDCSLFEVLAEQGFADVETFRKYDAHGCQGGNAYIAIDVHGNYKPCSFWNESFGSILDMSFDSWIHDPKLNEFRNHRKDESCARCDYEQLCIGGCRLLF